MKLLFQEKSINNFFKSFDAILFNTLPALRYSLYILDDSNKNNLRTMAWIHEAKLVFNREAADNDIKQLFEKIDEVYSVGEYSKSFTDKYVDSYKSHILLYGVEEIELDAHYVKPEEKLSFAIVGHVTHRKGHDIFVDAIKKLPDNIRSMCSFKIIGNFGSSKFAKRIEAIAKKESIICTGELSYLETLQEINQTDCIVCPSIDDPMPMVCTEAMMLKKVVLTSTNTGTASLIHHGENGFVFDANVESLIECIGNVCSQRDDLQIIGEKAKKIYEDNFTEEAFEKNILKIFM